jgi:hypothetical protein
VIEINGREIVLDDHEGLLAWTNADHVVWLAMDFIRRCPVEPRSGLPWYLAYSCFWTDPLRPANWPDNPAGKFAMAVETLSRYHAYSGETWFQDIVRTMLDRLIAYHTPGHFDWPGVPYASAEPVFGVYFGARADGHFITEPDKVAQAALAYLTFFRLTGEEKYFEHARDCARTLARHCQAGDPENSPWPFRVDVRTGEVVESYSSHVIPAIQLFEQLVALGIDEGGMLQEAYRLAWEWMFQVPMENGCWKGYFEDIRLDPHNENREQYSPMETARYLLNHPERDPEWQNHVQLLIKWVLENLGSEPFFKATPIHEQAFCYHVMGSHTARFASICARYAERTGQADYADLARRCFNWASYMTTDEGYVHVGTDRPDYYNQCWFSDGYFDYVPHFLEGMASLPDMIPGTSDHLLRTSSWITSIHYAPMRVAYRTYDAAARDVLKLTFTPEQVISGGAALPSVEDDETEGWQWDESQRVLRVHHSNQAVEVNG